MVAGWAWSADGRNFSVPGMYPRDLQRAYWFILQYPCSVSCWGKSFPTWKYCQGKAVPGLITGAVGSAWKIGVDSARAESTPIVLNGRRPEQYFYYGRQDWAVLGRGQSQRAKDHDWCGDICIRVFRTHLTLILSPHRFRNTYYTAILAPYTRIKFITISLLNLISFLDHD